MISTDADQCAWCDAAIGLISYESEFGPETDWVTIYRDTNSSDFACDECAGSASNFAETVAAALTADDVVQVRPELTDEMREHFAAFDHTELFLVQIIKTVKTDLGNVLIEEGEIVWAANNLTWVERFNEGFTRPASMSVWTKDTHYAGVKSSSVPAANCMRLPETTVML